MQSLARIPCNPEARNRFSFDLSEEVQPCLHMNLTVPVSKTVREYISALFKYTMCLWSLVTAATEKPMH